MIAVIISAVQDEGSRLGSSGVQSSIVAQCDAPASRPAYLNSKWRGFAAGLVQAYLSGFLQTTEW
jgi:hypothetical protein